jgi:hypothetical protein
MLLNLTQCIARQSSDRSKLPWNLERRHPIPATRLNIGRIKAFTHYRIRNRHLATNRIRRADHGRFRDLRLLFQKLLDLAWVNVGPARNDKIALSVAERVVTIGGTCGKTPVRKIIHKHAARSILTSPVTFKHVRSAQIYLTRFAIGYRLPARIQQPHQTPGKGSPTVPARRSPM